MIRRDFLTLAAAPLVAAEKRPNILFLFSDDHHFQCLRAAGNPHIHTPNLDRLAQRVFFRNGQVSTPQCCPSRGILLSGLETYQSGLLSNGQTYFKEGIGPTVIEQLKRSGYDTALIGKWHIQPLPAECGFAKAPLWLRGGASLYQNPSLRRGLDGKEEVVKGHITDLFTDTAIDYLNTAREPFFLWLAYNAPHTPWYAGSRYREQYRAVIPPPAHPTKDVPFFDWPTYYAVITHLDEAIGRLIAMLEKRGLWDNTLVFFLGDNGYLCGTKGLQGKVYPWEESIRVPFLVSGGLAASAKLIDDPAASIDLPATWLDFAGVKPAYPLAGRSLRSYITKGKGNHEAAFSAWADGRVEALAIRRAVEPYRLVRTPSHKYVLWESRKEALFDLRKDPHEVASITEVKMRKRLREHLAQRMKQTSDSAISWM